MDERELLAFTTEFPSSGYAVPDPDRIKNGAYFVQGRSQFFMFFTDEHRFAKACKIPGDVVQGKFRTGLQICCGSNLPWRMQSVRIEW